MNVLEIGLNEDKVDLSRKGLLDICENGKLILGLKKDLEAVS